MFLEKAKENHNGSVQDVDINRSFHIKYKNIHIEDIKKKYKSIKNKRHVWNYIIHCNPGKLTLFHRNFDASYP